MPKCSMFFGFLRANAQSHFEIVGEGDLERHFRAIAQDLTALFPGV